MRAALVPWSANVRRDMERLKAAMPGVDPKEVEVTLNGDLRSLTAAFKNGLLTVTLPKTPAAKGTTIPVKEE